MKVRLGCIGALILAANAAVGQSKVEARARQLEASLARFGYAFAAPTPIESLPAGEYVLACRAELERRHPRGWVECQRLLRQAFGIDSGKTTEEALVKLAEPSLAAFPVLYRSDTGRIVVDASRADAIGDQDLLCGLTTAWHAAKSGFGALLGGEARTSESISIGRALVFGEGELALMVAHDLQAGRDPKTINPLGLDSPLAKGLGDSLTRLEHRLGRDLALRRFLTFDWDGVRKLHDERPLSTEQLAHENKLYLDAPKPSTLPDWSADLGVKVECRDTLGEIGIFALLLDAGVPLEDAQVAAIGWDGDELEMLRTSDGAPAMVWRVFFDRSEDVKQFVNVLGPRTLGQVLVRGASIDWVRSDSVPTGQKLLAALEAAKYKVTPNEEDQRSTHDLEAALAASADFRPRVEGGRWLHPGCALSVPVPEGWVIELVGGQAFLMGPQIEKFKDNLAVTALDKATGASIDDLLARQKVVLEGQPGLKFEKTEKRVIDNREVGFLLYGGTLEKNDVAVTSMIYLYDGTPIVVTMTVARANLAFMQPIVDRTFAGVRFAAVQPGRRRADR